MIIPERLREMGARRGGVRSSPEIEGRARGGGGGSSTEINVQLRTMLDSALSTYFPEGFRNRKEQGGGDAGY